MVTAHQVVGAAVVAVGFAASVWGAIAYRRGDGAGRLLPHVLALAQTLVVAQVALGLLLLSDERRAPDDLHYAYGSFALLAILSPWLYAPDEPRPRLAWFAAATLLAALLAGRAYMTGS